MTLEDYRRRLAAAEQKFAEIEALIVEKIEAEQMKLKPDKFTLLKLNSQLRTCIQRATSKIDSIKRDYAMEQAPAAVGDTIEGIVRLQGQDRRYRERLLLMRVEEIQVADTDPPQMRYYGTYLRADGVPYKRQLVEPIYQNDIIKVVKINENGERTKNYYTGHPA